MREITGDQDAISGLRRRFAAITAKGVGDNLPPGPASDADVRMAKAGFPTANATGEQVMTFLRDMAVIEEAKAEYDQFRANFIAENGSTRNRQGQSMITVWREEIKSREAQNPLSLLPEGSQDNGDGTFTLPDGTIVEPE